MTLLIHLRGVAPGAVPSPSYSVVTNACLILVRPASQDAAKISQALGVRTPGEAEFVGVLVVHVPVHVELCTEPLDATKRAFALTEAAEGSKFRDLSPWMDLRPISPHSTRASSSETPLSWNTSPSGLPSPDRVTPSNYWDGGAASGPFSS